MLKNDDARSKHGENWKINNKIISCKISEQGIILEKITLSNSRNEIIKAWYTHLQNVLAKKQLESNH